MSDNYKLSFDYYIEYAVMEHCDYLCDEKVFVSRDAYEAFREMLAMDSAYQRSVVLQLRDPDGNLLYHRVLARVGKGGGLGQ